MTVREEPFSTSTPPVCVPLTVRVVSEFPFDSTSPSSVPPIESFIVDSSSATKSPVTWVPDSVISVNEDPDIAPPATFFSVIDPITALISVAGEITTRTQELLVQVKIDSSSRVGRDPWTAENPDVFSGAVCTEFPVSVTVVVPPSSA